MRIVNGSVLFKQQWGVAHRVLKDKLGQPLFYDINGKWVSWEDQDAVFVIVEEGKKKDFFLPREGVWHKL